MRIDEAAMTTARKPTASVVSASARRCANRSSTLEVTAVTSSDCVSHCCASIAALSACSTAVVIVIIGQLSRGVLHRGARAFFEAPDTPVGAHQVFQLRGGSVTREMEIRGTVYKIGGVSPGAVQDGPIPPIIDRLAFVTIARRPLCAVTVTHNSHFSASFVENTTEQ